MMVEDRVLLRVLIVDDDERSSRTAARFLEPHGLTVTCLNDAERGLLEASTGPYDLVILDRLEVCRELRERSDVPILLYTAGAEDDLVAGLEAGADDCMSKPYSARELLARIRAHVRRARGQVGPRRGVRKVGRLTVDPQARAATLDGAPLSLTGYELSLLLALADRPGKVLSREQLMELVRGNAEDAFDRSIDGHVSRLRQKLGDDPKQPVLLKTIRGSGYVLTESAPPQ